MYYVQCISFNVMVTYTNTFICAAVLLYNLIYGGLLRRLFSVGGTAWRVCGGPLSSVGRRRTASPEVSPSVESSWSVGGRRLECWDVREGEGGLRSRESEGG